MIRRVELQHLFAVFFSELRLSADPFSISCGQRGPLTAILLGRWQWDTIMTDRNRKERISSCGR